VLAVEVSDPAILAVATAPGDGTMVLYCFNDSPFERELNVPVPAGFRVAGPKVLETSAEGSRLVDGPEASGAVIAMTLPSRQAARWTFEKAGYEPGVTRRIEQSFVDVVMADVAPDAPVRGKVLWRGEGLPAKAASLRAVTRDVGHGEGVAVINGTDVPLPWSSSNEGCAVAQEVPIDPALLGAETAVEFRCRDPQNSNGFRVFAASILLER
jgi:hypothetical protein